MEKETRRCREVGVYMVRSVTPEGHNDSLLLTFHGELGLEHSPHAFRPEPPSLATFTMKFVYNIVEEHSKEITLEMAKLLPFMREHR